MTFGPITKDRNKNKNKTKKNQKNNMGKKWEKKQKPNSQKFFAGSGGFSSKLSIIPWNGKFLKKRRCHATIMSKS